MDSQRQAFGAAAVGHRRLAGAGGAGDRVWSFTPAILILAAAPLSFKRAPPAFTGTELNVSSARGVHLLIGLGEERDRDDRLRAHLQGGLPFQEAGARGPHPPAPDPHDHAVHAVRLLPLPRLGAE
jgi:hypothetical protein